MFHHLAVYVFLGVSSFLFILVPISGTATVTLFLTVLTDAHTAIALASFYFLMAGIVRIVIFRKEIQWHLVKKLLPISAVGAPIGALSLVAIPDSVLIAIIALFTLYFIFKRIFLARLPRTSGPTSKWGGHVIGLLSGFLQGTGLAGSDLRNNYLYGENLTLVQVHGTTACVGVVNFAIATAIRLVLHTVSVPDLTSLLVIFPFIVFGMLIGRHVALRIKRTYEDVIVIGVMLAGLVFLILSVSH